MREWCSSRECAGFCAHFAPGLCQSQKRSSRARVVQFTGVHGLLAWAWCTFCYLGACDSLRNGAPVREWCSSRECAGFSPGRGAHFAPGLCQSQKRSSRARVVQFAGVHGLLAWAWCTFCYLGACDSIRNGAPVREWCSSRECAGFSHGRGAYFVPGLCQSQKRSSRARVGRFTGVRTSRNLRFKVLLAKICLGAGSCESKLIPIVLGADCWEDISTWKQYEANQNITDYGPNLCYVQNVFWARFQT